MSPQKASVLEITFVLNEKFQQFKNQISEVQIVHNRVINNIDDRHYLLLINNQKIFAEFAKIIPVKSKIILIINSIAKRISLQYLGNSG